MLFAARTLGHKVRLYDGSMKDWSLRGLPVQKETLGPVAPRAPQPYANPYVAGTCLGLVLLAAFVLTGRGLGASGAFAAAGAGAVRAVAPEAAQSSPYFSRYLESDGRARPWHDWLVIEILGVVVGGFVSRAAAGRWRVTLERGTGMSARARGWRRRSAAARRWARARCSRAAAPADRRSPAARCSASAAGSSSRAAFGSAYAFARPLRARLGVAAASDAPTMTDSLVLAFVIGVGVRLDARARRPGRRAQAGAAVLSDRPHGLQGDVQRASSRPCSGFWLGRLGVLDCRRVYVPETFMRRSSLGGLVFGRASCVAGLCPGTSCVAAATGRGDGVAVVAGMFAGVLAIGIRRAGHRAVLHERRARHADAARAAARSVRRRRVRGRR